MTNTYLPLTSARIKKAVSLSKDVWLSDSPGSRGCGQLLARVTRRGICRFYFRYSRNGKRKTIPLGRYARNRTEGFLTLREARQVARGLSASLLPPITFLGAPVETCKSERRTSVARENDLLAVTAATPKRNDPTLLELCDLYCASLERQGKPSGKQQRYLIKHVERSEIGDRLAKDLRASDITPLLRGLVKANAGRTASKVRAMLHAAYAMALGSKYSATSDEAMGDHSIESNPVSQIPAPSREAILALQFEGPSF